MAERCRSIRRGRSAWVGAAEAALWLVAAGVALRTMSFARIARLASAPVARGTDPPEPAAAEAVGRAVEAAARRAPWPVRCFEKGLAAQAMLRRRGLPSVLHYGGRSDGSRGPTAHVWVTLGDRNVVGGAVDAAFAVLAAYPPTGPGERSGS